jgi:hypothetical protein
MVEHELGPRAAAFIEEVEAVCRKHGLSLSVSDYDGMQVWDLKPFDDVYGPIHCAGIEDCTGRADK